VLSFAAKLLRIRGQLRRVHPSIITSIESLISRAKQLVEAERVIKTLSAEATSARAECTALRATEIVARQLCTELHHELGDTKVLLAEAEQQISSMTGELELLRGIVDGESPGLSERIAQTVTTLLAIQDTTHDHD
jgi:chromosome segregation ATPase